MALGYQIAEMFDFSGGLNLITSPDNLAPNELSRAQNVDLFSRGGFAKRSGFSEYLPQWMIDTGVYIEELGGIQKLFDFEYYNVDGTTSAKILVLFGGTFAAIDAVGYGVSPSVHL